MTRSAPPLISAVVGLLLVMGCDTTASRDGQSTGAEASGSTARPQRRAARLQDIMRSLGIEEKVGQLLWPYAYGSSATRVDDAERHANQALYGVDTAAQLIGRYHVGGLIYLDHNSLDPARPDQSTHNLESPAQMARLSRGLQRAARADSGIGLLIATDQEGGSIARLPYPAIRFPAAAVFGRIGDERLANRAAQATGQELRAVGINVNFAPVADVNVEPANAVIGSRSFGRAPGLVSRMVRAQVRGLRKAGVAATAKHFPGHGDTTVDSHHGLPVVEHSRRLWNALDRPPFAAAISAGVPVVMTGHIAVPSLDRSGRPATLSHEITTNVLRSEMGFDGVVVTDALWMAGVRTGRSDGDVAVAALEAGADVLLMPPDLQAAVRAVRDALRSGRLSQARLDASVRRVLLLKEELGVLEPPQVDPAAARRIVGSPAHRALLARVLERA